MAANILVTGANGQLGSDLRTLSTAQSARFFFTDRAKLDITDCTAVLAFVAENAIDTIINCAAYTAVDKAESYESTANAINHLAVGYLAEAAKRHDAALIHISTDYVFDGTQHRPYIESDPTAPLGVYGKTKRLGEEALYAVSPRRSLILRTSWVYSSHGANFVKTMLRLGKERDALGVVWDQIGTPTYARDLAAAILSILPQLNNDTPQIYHYSNEGVLSWYDFAKEIMKMAKLSCHINPILSRDYPTPAKRPHFSLLDKSAIKEAFGLTIPYWKDSLSDCLQLIGEKQ